MKVFGNLDSPIKMAYSVGAILGEDGDQMRCIHVFSEQKIIGE
jgi:hypothetical protein